MSVSLKELKTIGIIGLVTALSFLIGCEKIKPWPAHTQGRAPVSVGYDRPPRKAPAAKQINPSRDIPIEKSMAYTLDFLVNTCLVSCKGNYSLKSSFVDINGNPYSDHLTGLSDFDHPFSKIEGPGWASGSVGAAHKLYLFAEYNKSTRNKKIALSLLEHVLTYGFIDHDTGRVWPYRDIKTGNLFLNYCRNNEWFCAGSVARIGNELLEFSDEIENPKTKSLMRNDAVNIAKWINKNVRELENGWYPRRCKANGEPYPYKAEREKQVRFDPLSGGKFYVLGAIEKDPAFQCSGDGLFIIQLMSELTKRGMADYAQEIRDKINLLKKHPEFCFGSINHDTYFKEENVSYAIASQVLRQAGELLNDKEAIDLSYTLLERVEKFRIDNYLAARGLKAHVKNLSPDNLYFINEEWPVSYMWENAEIAYAYLKAALSIDNVAQRQLYTQRAVNILEAMAKYHYGDHGFLPEGVDFLNYLGSNSHMNPGRRSDAIKWTEPGFNGSHLVRPTILYLTKIKR